jgi:hypothetical protein
VSGGNEVSAIERFLRFLRIAWPLIREMAADEAIDTLRRGYESSRHTQMHDRAPELEAHRRAIDELLAQRKR